MFGKIVALCFVVAVCRAALLPAPSHYSSSAAVSSQSIVRHEQPHIAIAPVTYNAAPVAYNSAPIAYNAAPVAYNAAPAAYSAPIAHDGKDTDYAHPKYEYNYAVADGHTGDNKHHQESRDGDVVKGSYSFHEADGSIRTVQYSADARNGFKAVVQNTAATAGVGYSAPSYYH